LEVAYSYLGCDACVTYVASKGGPHIGLRYKNGSFGAIPLLLLDTGASDTVADYEYIAGTGAEVKPADGLSLRIAGERAQDITGVATFQMVLKPGTRHETVITVEAEVIRGLKGWASVLLGRVEQHRLAAVIDGYKQLMLYMPKLLVGRFYYGSLPLLCHKPSAVQLQQREAARAASAVVAAASSQPQRPVAAVAHLQARSHVLSWYCDDAVVLDRTTGCQHTCRLPAQVTSLLLQGRHAHAAAVFYRLLQSGDVELHPGPFGQQLFGLLQLEAIERWLRRLAAWETRQLQVMQLAQLQGRAQALAAGTASCAAMAGWRGHEARRSAWVRRLTSSGDVEPNPGPSSTGSWKDFVAAEALTENCSDGYSSCFSAAAAATSTSAGAAAAQRMPSEGQPACFRIFRSNVPRRAADGSSAAGARQSSRSSRATAGGAGPCRTH
jgi:hypothetical protein